MKDIETLANNGSLDSDELRRRAVELISEVANDKKASRREKLSAGKALLAVAKVQQQIEQNQPTKSGRARAVEIAEQLGLAHALEGVPPGDPGASDPDVRSPDENGQGEGCDSEAGTTERVGEDSDSASEGLEST